MAVTKVNSASFGTIHVRKKRGVKNMRLRVDHTGTLHVTLPWLVPQALGLAFAEKHKEWVQTQQKSLQATITDGSVVNAAYKVVLKRAETSRITARLQGHTIVITLPVKTAIESAETQDKLRKKIITVVKAEAQETLGPLLYRLAKAYGYDFKDVQIKTLKSRWGSCSSEKVITLNTFAVQLPDYLQEYVILHELTHLNHMHHGKGFWEELIDVCPDAKKYRKELKNYQPTISIT